jgi:hypothetical protein
MCDCFFDELAYPRYNSATVTFINILISDFLKKEPRVRKRGEAKSQEFTSLMRTIFANLIISKAEPIIVSLMTGGQHHKNKIFINCINELVSQGSITLHKGEFHRRDPVHRKDINLISSIIPSEKIRRRERVLEKERMALLQPWSAASSYKSSKMEKHVGSVAEDKDDKIK